MEANQGHTTIDANRHGECFSPASVAGEESHKLSNLVGADRVTANNEQRVFQASMPQRAGFANDAAGECETRSPSPAASAPLDPSNREPLRGQLARNLRLCRVERDLSQEDLAKAVGLSRALINRIESGRFAVSLDALERLAETLEIEPLLLLGPLRLTRPCLELRELRERRGLSQSRLAVQSGVSRVSINRIENGKASAGPRTKRALAEALGVHPATIR